MFNKLIRIIKSGDLKRFIIYKYISINKFISENINYRLYGKNIILLEGHGDSLNIGDAINIPIVEYLSGSKVVLAKYISHSAKKGKLTFSVIGSILQWNPSGTHVWGSGFITNKNSQLPERNVYHSVRGPKTRAHLNQLGIMVPEAYGDPGLLLPFLYSPKINKKNKVGILPHYVDKSADVLKNYKKTDGFKIIDIEAGKNYKKFLDDFLSCEIIVTSSLHGVIFAHAYGIPVLWVKFSENITGGNFKYQDYFTSVGKTISEPVLLTQLQPLAWFFNKADSEPLVFDYNGMLSTCPFIKSSVKEEILTKLECVINKDDDEKSF